MSACSQRLRQDSSLTLADIDPRLLVFGMLIHDGAQLFAYLCITTRLKRLE